MSLARAFAKASSPHGYQSTGLSACWRRYGLVSCGQAVHAPHVQSSTTLPSGSVDVDGARVLEVLLVHVEAVFSQARDRRLVVVLADVHRVVDVRAALAAGDPDLRRPEADPRALADEEPCSIVGAAQRRQAEHLAVEPCGRVEIGDLEHELVEAGDREPAQVCERSSTAPG